MTDSLLAAAALAFAVALVVVLSLTPVVRRLAVRAGLLEAPGGRRIHHASIPRLGGIGIVSGWYLGVAGAVALLGISSGGVDEGPALSGLLLGTAIVAAAGIADDLRGLGPAAKLIVQVAAAMVAAMVGLRLTGLSLPWGSIELGALAVPFTVAWIVVVINALNLIDGLDGLAAGVTAIACAAFLAVALLGGQPSVVTLLGGAALLGACLAFLRYNLHPATIIMGDTGSMTLGFVLAGIAVTLGEPDGAAVSALVPLVVLALPLGDTLFAIVRRAARRQPISAPDAEHVHHRLVRGALSVRSAVLLLYVAAAALGLLGVLLARFGTAVA